MDGSERKSRNYEEWCRRIQSGDFEVSTSVDGAVFWEGHRNRERAEAFAQEQSRADWITGNPRETRTFEMTPGGCEMESDFAVNPHLNEPQKRELRRLALKKYTDRVQGNANTFVIGAGPRDPFRQEVMQSLLLRTRTDGMPEPQINGGSHHEFKGWKNSRDAAYRVICERELGRDLNRWNVQRDMGLKLDLDERRRTHEHLLRFLHRDGRWEHDLDLGHDR